MGIDGRKLKHDRRIHIDIRHLSTLARQEYYKIIDKHNKNNPEDLIPVILSHGAVNGKPSIDDNNFNPPDKDHEQVNSSGFNPWSINVYEEIIRIHKTKGLFGVSLDERIIAGKKKIKETRGSGRKKWGRIFTDQIEYVVKLVYDKDLPDKEEIWRRICIGSDFDGQINPANAFDTAKRFPRLRKSLLEEIGDGRFDGYRADYSVETLVDFICHDNAIQFLKTHYRV